MVAKIKAKLPPKFQSDRLQSVIDEAARNEAKLAKREFEQSVKTWKNRPRFQVKRRRDGGYDVFTDSLIYKFVSRGTRPHAIRPVRAKALAFPSGYSPKTSPNSLGAKPGGGFGQTRFAKAVQHPGTAPRKFEEKVQANSERRLQKAVNQAVSKEMRRRARR